MGLLMLFVVEPIMGGINTALNNGLTSMGSSSKIILGLILGGMMAIDMGGPFNKAAYVFGTAAIAAGNYDIMAAVMVGGMVPPCAIALATLLFQNSQEHCGNNSSHYQCTHILHCISHNRNYEDSTVRCHQGTAKCHGHCTCKTRSHNTCRKHMKRVGCYKRNGSLCDKGKSHNKVGRTRLPFFFRKSVFKKKNA